MTKADEKYCANQIGRLAGLDFFPTENAARGELIRVLKRHSSSNTHAERIIDRVLDKGFGEGGRSCPTPLELTEVATSVNPEGPRPVANAGCPYCFGTGWAQTEVVAATGPLAGQKYSAVKPCSCKVRRMSA